MSLKCHMYCNSASVCLDFTYSFIIFQIILTEIMNGEFLRTFKNSDSVMCFKDSENIFAIETPYQSIDSNIEQEKIILIIVCFIRSDKEECEL